MAIVETKGLRKEFDGVRAVDGVDLATAEGEFLVLLGPSGCGKTTLLRMIAGLETPTAGDVFIGGEAVTALPARARRIAMVFQSYALYPHLSVFKNIAFPLRAQRMRKAEIPGKVRWAASLFDIEPLLDRKPRQLSGGERQRVALARALVRQPAVFLLDEPLSNLDAKLRTAARDELKELQRRIRTTTLYVTHDQVEAMGLGDRIAVMQRGRIRQIGTPAEIYRDPADIFVASFLGSPPMNLLEGPDCLVGFRPEHFLPTSAQANGNGLLALPFRVTRVEYLGADRLLYGTLEGKFQNTRVIARLPFTVGDVIEPGQRYDFGVARTELRFFDRATESRAAPREM
ncbi:MAG TPA: ABC transporter ATP-binding protein [Methylomirabilota bacterium]|nr:ABC transporter ATP-binding protein [Methylomirabilota bacterium]